MRAKSLSIFLAATLVAAAGGCVRRDQAMAARAAIPADQVPGIKEHLAISWSWPEHASSYQFSQVQAIPFRVNSPDARKQTLIYVLKGKDARTGMWRVIYAAKRVGDQWVPVQLAASQSLADVQN